MGGINQLVTFDVVLALVNFAFAMGILQITATRKRKTYTVWFICLFLAMGFASLSKVVFNAFYFGEYTAKSVADIVSLLVIGLAGMAAWNIGAKIIFRKKSRLKVQKFSVVLYGIFFVSVISTNYDYFLLLIHNSLATVFLLYAFVIQFYRKWQKEVAFGVLGVFMFLLAMIVNQMSSQLTEDLNSFALFFNAISLISSSLIYYSARPLVKNDIY